MKIVVALLMGLCSGVMIYFMAAMTFTDISTGTGPSGALVAISFLGGWALSVWLLLRGAISISKVFSRGFLLGAAEWLMMVLVGFIFAGKTVAAVGGVSEAASVGAAVGGGLIAFLAGGISVAMAVVCLIGFAVSYSMGKEMRKETPAPTPTKKCHACAELVQAEAAKCRYCGETLATA
jgi:hypothetical protein